MPCDVIIGKGALNFPCEIPDRGHDGPHATPSILGSVQARQAWEAQQRQAQAQPGAGLPYSNYQQFENGVQKPHPRQMVRCFFCPVEVPYEEFYGHVGTHAAQPPVQAPPAPPAGSWEPQGPPPGTPAPSPRGVVGASSATALNEHLARHSTVMEAAGHMNEVMGTGTQVHTQHIPTFDFQGNPFPDGQPPNLWDEVQHLLNKYSRENHSQTPDFILAQFLASSLEAYEQAVNSRDSWYQLSQPQDGPGTS